MEHMAYLHMKAKIVYNDTQFFYFKGNFEGENRIYRKIKWGFG